MVTLGLQFLLGIQTFLLVVDFFLRSIEPWFVMVTVVEDVIATVVVEHSLLPQASTLYLIIRSFVYWYCRLLDFLVRSLGY